MAEKPKHPKIGNVIYANFGANRHAVSPEPEVKRRKSTQARSNSSETWLQELVEKRSDRARISRGEKYFRDGRVLNLGLANARITAEVVGSGPEPFQVDIAFPYRSKDDVSELITEIAATPNGIMQARSGELTPQSLGQLFAESHGDVRFHCDCPDPSVVCKHSIATLYAAIAACKDNPNLAFQLRDLNLLDVEQAVMLRAKELSERQATMSPEWFWQGGELPKLPHPRIQPALDDSDLQLLHQAMRQISYTSIDELRAVSDIEDMYDYLTRED
ncbi:hypothetical protein CMUST_06255 [Corynebacterium mustelae]|uniref:SWIM-type domain-containing protein n=1 Tax=Corynebacterium mustelae TaxID=571915 RepID=A0A0G3H377_9CORY|nr:hypothetical protein [Corynebacterium mustelae]AKK05587.1 hypothetical protein CMUST_06255 [Corynebacterium mustelae]